MSIATVLKVFKNSTIILDKREYTISRVFPTIKTAIKAHYFYYCTSSGTDIFSRQNKKGSRKYAIIG
jgi:hypothetical protein